MIELNDNIPTFSGSAVAKIGAGAGLVRTRSLCKSWDVTSTLVTSNGYITKFVSDGQAIVGIHTNGSGCKYSTDGTNFTAGAAPTNGSDSMRFAGANGTICGTAAMAATATGNIIRTTNHGASWTTPTLPTAATWAGLGTDGAGTWVAVSSSSTATMYSTDDGVTWNNGPALTTGAQVIVYKNGVWLASVINNANTFDTTTNPISGAWTSSTSYWAGQAGAPNVSSDRFVGSSQGQYYFSFNGKDWSRCSFSGIWYSKGLMFQLTGSGGGAIVGVDYFHPILPYRVTNYFGDNNGSAAAEFNDKFYVPASNSAGYALYSAAPYTIDVATVQE